ncbi:hypothetical protein [Legionella brunensis]|uniref:J domain-containing protein n=1 Tax=Legionella brunensis TaxID=29422 RepID=A0A0W0SV10_9GAMM|nr:hypothetical protein [Legionella brunensis]KTC87081.1 hypothetical protein Lbru_0310 [Legionella brunensis]
MPAINFDHAFEVLQLTPGATFAEIKNKYQELVSPKHQTSSYTGQSNNSRDNIVEAFNDLQLLVKPYEELDSTERRSLLSTLNEMPRVQLQFFLRLYPHTSFRFYWDGKAYPQLSTNICTNKATETFSSIGNFFTFFTSCHPSAGNKHYDNVEEYGIELPLWQKKNQ